MLELDDEHAEMLFSHVCSILEGLASFARILKQDVRSPVGILYRSSVLVVSPNKAPLVVDLCKLYFYFPQPTLGQPAVNPHEIIKAFKENRSELFGLMEHWTDVKKVLLRHKKRQLQEEYRVLKVIEDFEG